MRACLSVLTLCSTLLLGGCGYGTLQEQRAEVTASWEELVALYQARGESLPAVADTVQAYASLEEELLAELNGARARAGSIRMTPDRAADPAAVASFLAAQAGLDGALAHVEQVAQGYPDLQESLRYGELRAGLAESDAAIAAARARYEEAVAAYNAGLESFPGSLYALVLGLAAWPAAEGLVSASGGADATGGDGGEGSEGNEGGDEGEEGEGGEEGADEGG